MKKLIALSSFLFLFLLAALPAHVSLAAGKGSNAVAAEKNPNAVKVTGISLVTDTGEIKAVQKGVNFSFDLTGVSGKTKVEALKVTSDTAVTLSKFSKKSPVYSDKYDIHFVNGTVLIDKNKVDNWTGKQLYYQLFPSSKGTDYLFTVQELRNVIKMADLSTNNVGYVADAQGNESPVVVNFKTEGWVAKGGKWYYVNNQAANATGWVKENGAWYYMNPNGVMATGWVKDKGVWYYMNANGAMATGWVKSGSHWYYVNANGTMATGWVKSGSHWYYMNGSGAMATGWVKSGSHWYYMDGSGAMKTGWVTVGKHRYHLNAGGSLIG